jgi:hypothetical protein
VVGYAQYRAIKITAGKFLVASYSIDLIGMDMQSSGDVYDMKWRW